MPAPHFLRVVQAIALVPSFGPVIVAAGVGLGTIGCMSSESGVTCEPDDAGACVGSGAYGPSDAAADAYTGVVTGTFVSPDSSVADTGASTFDASFPVPDAGDSGGIIPVGGPLSPPDLPA